MSLETDLLEQARHLAKRERGRPRQASLRRAVSSAYYALFHLLVREASDRFLAGEGRSHLRHRLRRTFGHTPMKEASKAFCSSSMQAKVRGLLGKLQPQPELVAVAEAFVELQQARHDADYDTAKRFSRVETKDLTERAKQAFADWEQVRKSVQADAYLVALLTWKQLKT